MSRLNDTLSADSKRIMSYISDMAGSQGLYSRLWRDLHQMAPDEAENLLKQYHHCQDSLEFYLAYEC